MTDLEKLKQTFKDLEIEFTEMIAEREFGEKVATDWHMGRARFDTYLEIDEGIGYPGFHTTFYFLDGKCVGHGCWE